MWNLGFFQQYICIYVCVCSFVNMCLMSIFPFQMNDMFCSCSLQLSSVAPPPLCRNVLPNGQNLTTLSTDSSPKSTVNSPIQAPRRKFVGEGKVRKVGSVDQPPFLSIDKHVNCMTFSLSLEIDLII